MSYKVCHVTSVHPPEDVRIFYKECFSLTKLYEVYLIAPNIEDYVKNKIHVVGVPLTSDRKKRFLQLDRVYKKAKEIDADIYHFHDPELIPIGIKMKKLGKIIIFDSHEDVPMQILCKEYLPKFAKKPLSKVYSWYEAFFLSKYDALITVTPSIVERLKRINPCTFMVTNYPELTEFKPVGEIHKGFKVCFAGGVSARYMHENVIKAIRNTNATYLLAGQSYPGYIDNLKKIDGWEKVEYLGVVNHDKVCNIYSQSMVGIVLLDYTANVGYHRGTLGVLKLFEYMMAGIPVIATDFELWKDIVERYDCGVCVNPHDINAIADAVNFFVENPDIAIEKGLNGRKAVEFTYNWATQEKVLFDVYNNFLKRNIDEYTLN